MQGKRHHFHPNCRVIGCIFQPGGTPLTILKSLNTITMTSHEALHQSQAASEVLGKSEEAPVAVVSLLDLFASDPSTT